MTSSRPTSATWRRVLTATITVVFGYGLAKLIGFARQIIVAHAFGTSWQMDAYSAAFEPADVLFTIISVGALGTAFIPVLTDFLDRRDDDGANRLTSAILTLTFIIGVALAVVLALVAAPVVQTSVGRGFTPEGQALTTQILRIILLAQIVLGVSGVMAAALQGHQHFLLPALAPALYNVGIIVGALLLAPRMGIYGLAWGAVVGSSFGLLVQMPGFRRFNIHYRPLLALKDVAVRKVGVLAVPRFLSLAIFNFTMFFNTTLASTLATGSVVAFFMGWSLMQLPETLFATAVGTAVFPTMAEMASRNQIDRLRATMASTLRAISALTIPTAIGMLVLAQPLVAVLFQRGAFNAESTALVAASLWGWCLGLVAHSALEIVARTFFAMKDTFTPLKIGFVSMLINMALALALREPLGVTGLALANSIAFSIETIVLLVILRRRIAGIQGRWLLVGVAKITASAAVAGVVMFLLRNMLADQRSIVILVVAGLAGALVYAAGVLLLGLDEARLLVRVVSQRLQRRAPAPIGE
ncbi:MAG: murein biosynthesis integral membrane protein MurJ [Anaerolineae bacterium]